MLSEPTFWLALGGTALGVAILVLKFVAPLTKTTKDDEALKVLEKAAEVVPVPAKV